MDVGADGRQSLVAELAEVLARLVMPRVGAAGRAARLRRTPPALQWRQSGTVSMRRRAARVEIALEARVESAAAVPLQVAYTAPRLAGVARALLLPGGIATIRLRGSLPIAAACDFDLLGSFAVGDWPGAASGAVPAAAAATCAWAIGDDFHVGEMGEVLPLALRPFIRVDAAGAPPHRAILRGWMDDTAVAVVLRERKRVAEVRPLWRNTGAIVAR